MAYTLRPMTDEDFELAVQLIKERTPTREVARRLGHTSEWLYNALQSRGTTVLEIRHGKKTQRVISERDPQLPDQWHSRLAAMCGSTNPRWLKCIIKSTP